MAALSRARRRLTADLIAAHPDLSDLLSAMAADLDPAATNATAPRVLGDFRILREVGRGGMGVIYEARQTTLGRRVALKVLLAEISANPTALARLCREALALARLRHPDIVGIHDVGETEGVPPSGRRTVEACGCVDRVVMRRAAPTWAEPLQGRGLAAQSANRGGRGCE